MSSQCVTIEIKTAAIPSRDRKEEGRDGSVQGIAK